MPKWRLTSLNPDALFLYRLLSSQNVKEGHLLLRPKPKGRLKCVVVACEVTDIAHKSNDLVVVGTKCTYALKILLSLELNVRMR